MSNIKIEHLEEYKDGVLNSELFYIPQTHTTDIYLTREELEAIQAYEIPAKKEVSN